MTESPVNPDVDLRDFPFTPVFRARLFGSSFHARATDAEWRAGVTLWLKSWDQTPAGSLPDDDIDLCRLAELGRDMKTWRKVRSGAMRGWAKCEDGRLYHEVVAEGVNEAWQGKLQQRWRTECARVKKHNQRDNANDAVPTFDQWLSLRQHAVVPKDKGDVSPETDEVVPEETASKRERKGEIVEDADNGMRQKLDSLESSLRLAAGGALDPTSISLIRLSEPLAWAEAGCDLELDVLPVLRAVSARASPQSIRSWKYFNQAVADAKARRLAPMPEGRTDERTNSLTTDARARKNNIIGLSEAVADAKRREHRQSEDAAD